MTDGINTISDLLSNPSFVRWTEGKADRTEARIWDKWCRKSDFNRKLALRAQTQILGFTPSLSRPENSEQKWLQFSSHITSAGRSNSLKRGSGRLESEIWWYRTAAIIVVAVITGLITYSTGLQSKEEADLTEIVWHHVETDYAEQKNIMLSDGSSIILGAHSSLNYPEGWVKNNAVEVRLEGEAFFDISKREGDEPVFRVKTADGTVEVLGTRFAVDSEEERTRVVLEEGAVKITGVPSADHEEDYVVQLNPNEMVEFSRSNTVMDVKRVNPDIYISWTENMLTLDNTPFRILTDRVRKSFGVKVKVNNPELYERRLTGNLNLKTLDYLMNAISEVLEIEVAKLNDTVVFG